MKPFFFRKKQAEQDGVVTSSAAGGMGLIPDQHALFAGKRQGAVETGADVLAAVASDLARGERHLLEMYWQQLDSLFNVVELADEGLRLLASTRPPAAVGESTVPVYFVSSWFLADCQAYLLSDPDNEVLLLVTGIRVSERHRTLERMLKVDMSAQSAIHAVANQQDLKRLLIECSERWGHSVHGLFHRHPGLGPRATSPSSTDFATHERYERGYPLVGAIFVQDGYVRFFSHQPFTITLYGKGVEQLDTHLFKIHHHPGAVSYDTPQSMGERA